MKQEADFLKKQAEDTLFAMRIYEMYIKKAPYDKPAEEIYDGYAKRYKLLIEKYDRICDTVGKGGS